MMRKCRDCGETKPLAEFAKNKRCTAGHSFQCKACLREYARKWRERNPGKLAANHRKWSEHSRRVRAENPDGQREHSRAYCREIALWRQTAGARKAAQERGARIVELVSPLVVLERDDGVCGVCGEDVDPMDFHLDHIVPCCEGGDHSYENVQLAHPGCNIRKSNEERKAAA